MRITKQLVGPTARIELIGETEDEVINWRDYFFNWGAIQIGITRKLTEWQRGIVVTEALDRQKKDIEQLRDGFHFHFYASKQRLINAFQKSAEAQIDWQEITEQGGQPARKRMSAAIKNAGQQRFDDIPCVYDRGSVD